MTVRLLSPVRSRENQRVLYIYNEYLKMFKKMNAEIIMITPSSHETYEKLLEICDGLLLTGGGDINPTFYNQQKHEKTEIEMKSIEHMEFTLIELFSQQKKPIIGICRGIQTINVFFNGTLIQDLPSQYNHEKAKNHLQSELTGYSHYVEIQPNTLLAKELPKQVLVNSFHHQNIDKVAPGFKVNAISEDGLVEGIEKDNIVGVQWHPEKTVDEAQEQLLRVFHHLF